MKNFFDISKLLLQKGSDPNLKVLRKKKGNQKMGEQVCKLSQQKLFFFSFIDSFLKSGWLDPSSSLVFKRTDKKADFFITSKWS